MSEQTARGEAGIVLSKLHDAMNRHDLSAFLACFDADYKSEQPVPPDRQFGGQAVQRNASASSTMNDPSKDAVFAGAELGRDGNPVGN